MEIILNDYHKKVNEEIETLAGTTAWMSRDG